MASTSASLCAVVMKQGKLSRMWMPRLRIMANSRSWYGWSSVKTIRQTEAKCLTAMGAPCSWQKALSESASFVVVSVSLRCSSGPASFRYESTAWQAASASGCRTKVPAK